ncbi:pyrrolidone-carboxylate peptidase [Kibdelosporangium banguiense]|uniref:Pyrrolidone-carboxylate peptidase n=1 Tax=Kibdelosporangium banguiense TaxID=1365924 RepID=A0ABS4TJJ3_9PSEU|nr:pyroglutamyl peptidase [Kibdelosporangium banguiense]MBP2324026.1 pyrrolidone-carboxylate peptidase [Kibdelosporangium banguiense]
MKIVLRRALTCGIVIGSLIASAPLAVAQTDGTDCFDRTVAVTVSERRIDLAVPQELLRRSGFDRFSPRFERLLCAVRSKHAAELLVRTEGANLWRAAVDRVQGRGPAGGDLARADDRPLYWARLQLTKALRQWRPSFNLTAGTRTALINSLEAGSRGQDAVTFPPGRGLRKVLVSGFDPFQLDGDIRRSNPSGANALALDGVILRTPTGPAMIRTAMFPVLWSPFEAGTVERTFLSAMPELDMFATVSQGRVGRIDIERYNGRWHTGPDNDNENRASAIPIPSGIPTVTPQPEFVPTTLPYAKIVAAPSGRFPVFDNTSVTEIPAGTTTPVVSPTGPTPGSVARAGGGGSYLSNEIAYRTTLLRDALKLTTPGGHIHTPVLLFAPDNTTLVTDPTFEQNRTDIVAQIRKIIETALS